ncbi:MULTISPECIES: sigma-54 dependent transcriptional regulator [Pseudomonas syringae group]|uniref:Sigma-54 dependent transcription regulator n=1 Tax=Pseudomonas syringae pv. ribicola TaxID=55398 RepID=A0A0N8SQR0_PSESI|nr:MULTISPECIES: sigma-54 dependent transcriptional regulator [Pseudomonas syringae group]EKN48236.1 sigma-54 dependent transcription regulator [Pseudomonas viridiflava UASWS0038]KPL65086.1 Fis family transcriptional regulator [Pseudomonas viridiflava]KPY49888.1 Sigma-54 dependent transcription regulator [Pseudomonas syringae pv. ribicola]KPZ27730.1 Sigma-54 dependent transcription regulator [Pseudomonas viridiflava]OAG88035.1 Fis family transcriptional regulator [Pseudomonas viridiflava]
MHESAPTRRLLIVDPCDDCHLLIPVLHAAGWAVDSSTLESALNLSCDVGLIRLMPDHFEHPEMVKELITRTNTQWIAVLAPDDLRREKIGDFVCEWFFDFHTLPFDVARMQVTLGRAYGMARLRAQGAAQTSSSEHEMLGESRPIRELRRLLGKLAPTESPVMIRGERGTGKELVARTLHAQSQRRNKPFVAVNCGAIAEHLIHAELFGYEKGAFNGAQERKVGRIEAADGGTLFLDEIGDLPLETQAHLLRFLQDRQIERIGSSEPIPVDVRVLAATHVDLEAAIRKKRFREDLYYRLNVLQVGTAPLRERHGDLAMLANHFAHFYSQETGRRARNFSQDALIAMGKHDWPGNVRELANRVRRGLVLAEGRQIEAVDLGLLGEEDIVSSMGTLDDYKSRAERQALCDVLTRHSDNLSVAAKVLGISRPTFYRLLHKHQIR